MYCLARSAAWSPAGQGRLGSIDAYGDQDTHVPFFKRYFLGGATNLRGWGRFEVSPLSGAGLPIGGFFVFQLFDGASRTIVGQSRRR